MPDLDTQGSHCTTKYLGPNAALPGHVTLLNVRPDGYVGSLKTWEVTTTGTEQEQQHSAAQMGADAAQWLQEYFARFLAVPLG